MCRQRPGRAFDPFVDVRIGPERPAELAGRLAGRDVEVAESAGGLDLLEYVIQRTSPIHFEPGRSERIPDRDRGHWKRRKTLGSRQELIRAVSRAGLRAGRLRAGRLRVGRRLHPRQGLRAEERTEEHANTHKGDAGSRKPTRDRDVRRSHVSTSRKESRAADDTSRLRGWRCTSSTPGSTLAIVLEDQRQMVCSGRCRMSTSACSSWATPSVFGSYPFSSGFVNPAQVRRPAIFARVPVEASIVKTPPGPFFAKVQRPVPSIVPCWPTFVVFTR
jgi:hypothetical protein